MFKSNKLYKGYLYDSIKEDIEEKFTNQYPYDNSASVENCISEVLNDRWDEVLDDEDYEGLDENRLWDSFSIQLEKDIDEKDLIESLSPDEDYHGLSARQRNPFLR